MKFIAAIAVCLVLCSCASTTIYENGVPVLTTQADMLNVEFRTARGTSFKAAVVNHSTPTLAGGAAVTQSVGAVSGLAGTIALAANPATAPVAVVPAAASQLQGVVRPTSINIQNQWVSPSTGKKISHKKKHVRHRHKKRHKPIDR